VVSGLVGDSGEVLLDLHRFAPMTVKMTRIAKPNYFEPIMLGISFMMMSLDVFFGTTRAATRWFFNLSSDDVIVDSSTRSILDYIIRVFTPHLSHTQAVFTPESFFVYFPISAIIGKKIAGMGLAPFFRVETPLGSLL
jgi:hypothetical protein